MSRDIAAEIQKEFGEVRFDNQTLQFGYNSVELIQKLTLSEKISFILGLSGSLSVILLFDFPLLAFIVFLFSICAGIVYKYYNRADKVVIDFIGKEIKLKNRLPFTNSVRSILKMPMTFSFREISHFTNESGRFKIFQERRNSLTAKFFDHSPIILAQFRFERDARRLGELLQHYIVGKPRIIK